MAGCNLTIPPPPEPEDTASYFLLMDRLITGGVEYPSPSTATGSFSVMAEAPVDTVVGSVSATDAEGDIVTYAITAGNDAGLFALDSETGAITVVGDLSGEAGSSFTLSGRGEAGRVPFAFRV